MVQPQLRQPHLAHVTKSPFVVTTWIAVGVIDVDCGHIGAVVADGNDQALVVTVQEASATIVDAAAVVGHQRCCPCGCRGHSGDSRRRCGTRPPGNHRRRRRWWCLRSWSFDAGGPWGAGWRPGPTSTPHRTGTRYCQHWLGSHWRRDQRSGRRR